MDATPSVRLPRGETSSGVPQRPPAALRIRDTTFTWGSRTYVMGIINVTPDSFSGDGLLRNGGGPRGRVATAAGAGASAAAAQADRMVDEGADILDVGGELSRPGHADVPAEEELRRVIPAIAAIRAAHPDMPISIDTTKAIVAAAALDAGADAINDVWAVGPSKALMRLAGERGVPYVLMHNREEPRYRAVVAEVIADLERTVDWALAAGCAWESLIVDPGIGFGKTADQNLAVLRDLPSLSALGRPVLLGASRKSTIGKVLDLPADQRLEGTLALTALAVGAGVDMVRVHDVGPNLRVARMADAVIRGTWHEEPTR